MNKLSVVNWNSYCKIVFLWMAVIYSNFSFCQCSSEELINMRKTAIVFGEKSYKYSKPLSNTLNDAKDVTDSLTKMGFEVDVYYDDNYENMTTHINKWYSKIDQYDVALFYYSGHGIEYEGENYLLPIDADPKQPSDLHLMACSANAVLNNMESNKNRINILILDACRDNPLLKSWTRSIGLGLETMRSEGGSFVGFAAGPGKVAREGTKRNGIYTESLLKYINTQNVSIYDVFTLINKDVRTKTFGAQIPYISSSLSKSFCFNPENKLSFLDTKKSSIIQPESNFVLSPDGNFFIKNDPKNQELLIQNTKNGNKIEIKKNDPVFPYKIIATVSNVYVIDTITNSFYAFNLKKKVIEGNIKLRNRPLSFTLNSKENRAYILSRSNTDTSFVDVIDLVSYKQIKNTVIYNKLSSISSSTDDNYLYINTSYSAAKKGIYMIENKTNDKPTFIEGIGCGDAISVAQNNKLYASNINSDGIDQINIIEHSTTKVLNTLNFKVISFKFTYNKKYVLAVGMQDILLIDALTDKSIGRIRMGTKINGIAITDSNYVFSSLSPNNRSYSFSLLEKLRKDSTENNEFKSKLVQERINLKRLTDPNYKINEIVTKASQVVLGVMYNLVREWGPSFDSTLPDYMGPNYADGTLKCHMVIVLRNDQTKNINIFLNIKVDSNYFIMTLEDKGIKEPYTSLNRNIEWNKIEELVKTFFLDRSSQLGL